MNHRDVAGLIAVFHGHMSSGINWTWAFFDTEASANAFHTAITSDPTIETRGVYPPSNPNAAQHWGVRYR